MGMPTHYTPCEFLDNLGVLHGWLTDLLEKNPQLKDCSVFTIDGDGFGTHHLLWCTEDGSECEPSLATEVSIYCTDISRK